MVKHVGNDPDEMLGAAMSQRQFEKIASMALKSNTRITIENFGLRLTMWVELTGDKRITQDISYHDLFDWTHGAIGPVRRVENMLDLMAAKRKTIGGRE